MVDAALGTAPLRSLQAGIETTRGTTKAATRVIPFLSCDITPNNERSRRSQTRASYKAHYDSGVKTKHWVDIALELVPSYEYFVYFAAGALKGVVTPTNSSTAVETFPYTPTDTSDDLKTYTLEALTDVTSGDYDIPFAVVSEMSWGWEAGGVCTLNVSMLGQQLTAATPTGALSVVTYEEFDPTLMLAWMDAGGGTIGTTAITNLKSVRYTIGTGYEPDYLPDGYAYPGNWVRTSQRSMRVEAEFDFTTNTEALAFASGTTRLFRTKITGSTITSSSPSTPKSITADTALVWDQGPFRIVDGRIRVACTGETHYSSADSLDWSVSVAQSSATTLTTT